MFKYCAYNSCYCVTEDNNTRVLFERVLSSGSLEPEKSVYVQIIGTFVDLSYFNSDSLQINPYYYENIFLTGIYGIVFWNSNLTLEI